MVIAVMAVDSMWGVGKDNNLPWPKNNEDMKFFKSITQDKIVIMGRKTWESIGSKKLPNRTNIVLSSNKVDGADLTCHGDVPDVMEMLCQIYPEKDTNDFCVIGGANIIEQFHNEKLLDTLFLTYIEGIYGCDTFFNKSILDSYICFTTKVLKDDTPRTILKVYDKGLKENEKIQRYDTAYFG